MRYRRDDRVLLPPDAGDRCFHPAFRRGRFHLHSGLRSHSGTAQGGEHEEIHVLFRVLHNWSFIPASCKDFIRPILEDKVDIILTADAQLITDDYNPVNFWRTEGRLHFREELMEFLGENLFVS